MKILGIKNPAQPGHVSGFGADSGDWLPSGGEVVEASGLARDMVCRPDSTQPLPFPI